MSALRRALVVGALSAAVMSPLLVACGGTTMPPPDLKTRTIPGNEGAPRTVADASDIIIDAGPPDFDAGPCCTVQFALPAEPSEVAATLVWGPEHTELPLALDGGAWRGEVCMALVDTTYFYRVGIPADEDAGLFETVRVNTAAPTDTGLVSTINLFEPAGAMTCQTLDAGVHQKLELSVTDSGVLPGDAGPSDAGPSDAGPSDAGPSDAGAGPVLTTIAGACDTLSAATVHLDSAGGTNDLDDVATTTVALPFAFTFYGSAMSHWAASSNGYLQLFTSSAGTITQRSFAQSIPDSSGPNGFVAPLWNDLLAVNGTQLRSQLFGSGSARHLTVEWTNWTFALSTGVERVTVQAKLFESSNAVELHYCLLQANGGTTQFERGFLTTAGIESPDGSRGVTFIDGMSTLTTTQAARIE